jgi:hypothetical protein
MVTVLSSIPFFDLFRVRSDAGDDIFVPSATEDPLFVDIDDATWGDATC